MILVDSSVWIDYFNGKRTQQSEWLHSALGNEFIVMGDLILAEVLQGFKKDSDFNKVKEMFLNFPFMEMLGLDLAVKSAENYRFLRKKGVTVRKTIDILIGTFCIHHKISLLHDDQDFIPLIEYMNLSSIM